MFAVAKLASHVRVQRRPRAVRAGEPIRVCRQNLAPDWPRRLRTPFTTLSCTQPPRVWSRAPREFGVEELLASFRGGTLRRSNRPNRSFQMDPIARRPESLLRDGSRARRVLRPVGTERREPRRERRGERGARAARVHRGVRRVRVRRRRRRRRDRAQGCGNLPEPRRAPLGGGVVARIAPRGVGDAVPRERRGVQRRELVRARAKVRGGGHETLRIRRALRRGVAISGTVRLAGSRRGALSVARARRREGGELVEVIEGANSGVELGELRGRVRQGGGDVRWAQGG